MMGLSSCLLTCLFAVTLATSKGTDVTKLAHLIEDDVKNTPHLKEQLLIYDVISDAKIDDIKARVGKSGVTVRHIFKVIGTFRYFFVIVDDESDALNELTFPQGSVVTQYPVENLDELLETIEVTKTGIVDSPNLFEKAKSLVLVIRDDYGKDGQSGEEYVETLQNMFGAYVDAWHKVQIESIFYVSVGAFPLKFFSFMDVSESVLQKVSTDTINVGGGVGSYQRTVFRLRKIPMTSSDRSTMAKRALWNVQNEG